MMWIFSFPVLILCLLAFSSTNYLVLGFLCGLAWAFDHWLYEYLSYKNVADGMGTWGGSLKMLSLSIVLSPCFFILLSKGFFNRINEYKLRYSSRQGIQWYEIQPIEPTNWHWIDPEKPWRGGWNGMVVGLVVALTFWMEMVLREASESLHGHDFCDSRQRIIGFGR